MVYAMKYRITEIAMTKNTDSISMSIYQDIQDVVMELSDDGFIRMVFGDLMRTRLFHLVSINEENSFAAPYTKMFGYTEWVSQTPSVVSIGWDWKLKHDDRVIDIVRTGLPRSNLMLMDDLERDVGLDQTLHLICQKIDSIGWEAIVKEQILKSTTNDNMTFNYS